MDTSQDEDADMYMTHESRKRDGTEVGGTGRVAQQVNLLEHTPHLDTNTSPLKEQEKKRLRRSGGKGKDTNNNSAKSALSFESDRAE